MFCMTARHAQHFALFGPPGHQPTSNQTSHPHITHIHLPTNPTKTLQTRTNLKFIKGNKMYQNQR